MRWLGILVGAVGIGLAKAERPLKFEVEATTEHYGSRGVCIEYRVPGQSLVTGYVKLENPHENIRSSILVYDTAGNQPFSQPDLRNEAPFSFRSLEQTTQYQVCTRALPKSGTAIPPSTSVQVELLFKYKFDLFDEKLAKEFKIKPIESEFFQLEETMSRLANELEELVRNEEAMRDINESTLDRLRVFAILSIIVLVSLGLYQILYLKRFFKTKKLI